LSDSDLIIFHLLLLILTKIAKEAISVLPISIALGVAGQLLYGLAVIMLGKKDLILQEMRSIGFSHNDRYLKPLDTSSQFK
jgi:hypothetical protein